MKVTLDLEDLGQIIESTVSDNLECIINKQVEKCVEKKIDEVAKKVISENIKEQFKGKNYSEQFLNIILPGKEDIVKIMTDAKLLNKKLPATNLNTFNYKIISYIEKKVKEYNRKRYR